MKIRQYIKKYSAVFLISFKKSRPNLSNLKKYTGDFKNMKLFSSSSMSLKDQTFFIKRLSFLLKAGIPVLESLIMIREQTKQKSYAFILDNVIKDVSGGQYLSTSLGKYKNIFGEFSINIISFGESAGILSDNLNYLADELKKKSALRKKVVGAFIYPAIVTLATLGITGFLMIYLFPKIMPVFSSLHIKLPLSTRVVISMSNFLTKHGFIFIFTIIALIFAFIFSLKRFIGFRFYYDKTIMKIPMIGNVIKHYNLANAMRTMGLLLKSGLTLGETLGIMTNITENLVYKAEFKKMSTSVNRGEQLSIYLAKNPDLFPDVLTQIISVGERSGNLSNSFIYLSELYESEVEEFTKNISTLIEPVLMVVMGILVGFIAISIITPIYSITQNLH